MSPATLRLYEHTIGRFLRWVRSEQLLGSSQPNSLDAKESVVELLCARPDATWRVVREHTGLSDANAKRALTAARRALRNGC